MANSDNVLRCGLTPKHVDVAEVLKIADFTPLAEPRCSQYRDSRSGTFQTRVPDFALSAVDLDATGGCHIAPQRPQVVLCTSGLAWADSGGASVELRPGHAAFVAAGVPGGLTVRGTGMVFLAGTG